MELAQLARQAADDKKAVNVRLLDIKDISDLADYVLVMSGTTAPQLKAIFQAIDARLKSAGVVCHHKSGDSECGWIVMDYLDIIIHIYHPRMRQYYAIEELWEKAPAVQ